jgi:hypothetical protein
VGLRLQAEAVGVWITDAASVAMKAIKRILMGGAPRCDGLRARPRFEISYSTI